MMQVTDYNAVTQPTSTQLSTTTSRRWKAALLAMTLLAFFLRLYFAFSAVVDHPIRGDAIQYFTAAWNMVNWHVFSITPPGHGIAVGDSYRDPGFPTFLAGWLLLFHDLGKWYSAVLATQALLGALTIPLLLSTVRPLLPDRWILSAGLIAAVWPHSVTICSYLLSETLFGFMCSLSLFLLNVALNRRHFGWYVLAGLCFGAAGLTNAVLVPFALLLAISMYLLRYLDRKFAMTLAMTALLLPLGWQLRNAQLPPSNESAGTRAMINFVQGSWPEYQPSWRAYRGGNAVAGEVQDQIMAEYNVLHNHPLLGIKSILRRFAQAPWYYFSWYMSKPAHLWGWDIQIGQGDIYVYPTLHSPFNYNPVLRILVAVCQVVNPILALLAAWGCVAGLSRRFNTEGCIVAPTCMILYVTLIYSLLQAEPRYSIPFRGIEILLATLGLAQLWTYVKPASLTRV